MQSYQFILNVSFLLLSDNIKRKVNSKRIQKNYYTSHVSTHFIGWTKSSYHHIRKKQSAQFLLIPSFSLFFLFILREIFFGKTKINKWHVYLSKLSKNPRKKCTFYRQILRKTIITHFIRKKEWKQLNLLKS